MKKSPLFVRIDVSKDRLDVAVRPTGETWQVSYDADGINSLTGYLSELTPHLVVVEATGGSPSVRSSGQPQACSGLCPSRR